MPQFSQIDSFAGQIFWLIISFVALYVLMVQVIMPRIAHILELRQQRIDDDLARAKGDHEEAQKIIAQIDEKLAKARAEAREQLASASAKQAEELAKQLAKIDAELKTQSALAVSQLEEEIKKAKSEIKDLAADLAGDIAKSIGQVDSNAAQKKQAVSQAMEAGAGQVH